MEKINIFKNCDFSMQLDIDDIDYLKKHPDRDIETISHILDDYSIIIVGNHFALDDFGDKGMGCFLYSYFTDRGYIFPFSCIDDMINGEVVTIKARKVSDDERKLIKDYLG